MMTSILIYLGGGPIYYDPHEITPWEAPTLFLIGLAIVWVYLFVVRKRKSSYHEDSEGSSIPYTNRDVLMQEKQAEYPMGFTLFKSNIIKLLAWVIYSAIAYILIIVAYEIVKAILR